MALPTWGQKCIVLELEPKDISNFDLGHPVLIQSKILNNSQEKWRQSYFWLKLRVVQKKHLEKVSNCSPNSFYECYAALIKASDFKNRTRKCLPKSLGRLRSVKKKVDLSDIPICQNSEEENDAREHLVNDIFYVESYECLESCVSREYTGKVDYEGTNNDHYTFGMTTRFARPYKMTVFEEYLLYDFNGLVGTVGGTLGLFIGFSFYDVILKITNYLKTLRN